MSKFTEKKGIEIVGAVRAGALYHRAAESVGVTRRTFLRWRTEGEADFRAGRRTKLASFWQEFSKANAEVVAKMEKSLVVAGETDWRAHAWMLRHRAPEDYSDPDQAQQLHALKQQATQELFDLIKRRGKPETFQDLCHVLAEYGDAEADPRKLPVPE